MSTHIRIASLEGFQNFVLELGAEPAHILDAAGLDETLLNAPEALIPSATYRRILNLAAEMTSTPRFGLLLSQRQSFEKLGAVGYLAKHAPTLGEAARLLHRFLSTHDTATASALSVANQQVLWRFRTADALDEPDVQQSELALGLVAKFVRSSVDERWSPTAVHFAHARPADLTDHQRVFRCPVFFDQDATCLEFPANDLDKALKTSDPKLFQILLQHTEQVFHEMGNEVVDRVRLAIHQSIEAGAPTLDMAARLCDTPRPRLQRALKRSGTSFQKLLEEERFSLAKKYLRDTHLSLAAITSALCYAETPVFTRAFKRMSGMTPSDWRKQISGQ